MSARRRRPGIRVTAGLIVEGDTEYSALPRLATKHLLAGCPPLKAINLGGIGSDVEPIGIAKQLRWKVLQHRAAGRTPIVVCIDREDRDMSAATLAHAIWHEIECLKVPLDGVFVAVMDRTFEAWLLADARGLHAGGQFTRFPKFHSFEGAMGKRRRKGLIELSELLGRPYAKTVDGPALFEKINFAKARRHGPNDHGSRSLDAFLTSLGI